MHYLVSSLGLLMHRRPASVYRGAYLGCLLSVLLSGAAEAQGPEVLATALTGRPYGIATIEIPLSPPVVGNPLPPLQVTSVDGRLLFPMSQDMRVELDKPPSERPVPPVGRGRLLSRVGNLIRELSSDAEQLEQTVARKVTFLFLGERPLQVSLRDSRGEIGTYELQPVDDPQAYRELMSSWWSRFTSAAKRQLDAADYPPRVETYLVAMLSGRLGLPLPSWYPSPASVSDQPAPPIASDVSPPDSDDSNLLDTLKLIGGAGSVADEVFAIAAVGNARSSGDASLPLPEPPQWDSPPTPEGLDSVTVEPLASRVPPECFYIRYGSFANYLWFNDLSREYGGDISRMVTLRGLNDNATGRLERQLSVQTTELARMLGPAVIADQAIIGRDLFLTDGAAMGALFRASNAFLLRSSMNNDRTQRAKNDKDVSLTQLTIAGRPVSFLSSIDNQVRSYMAVDGDTILVTNSRYLVERFFEVGESGDSLAASTTFRMARQAMPVEREDTIFAYFSPMMLQSLLSPEYLIELRRRFHARADISLVHLARIAAEADGQPLEGVNALVAGGYLPGNFGRRADGSGAVTVGDRVLDSLRGERGFFVPIADIDVGAVTPEEAAWYNRIARQYNARFPYLDPLMIGVQREQVEGQPERERITVHAEISPFQPEKYGWIAEQLGPPTRVALEFAPDDIAAAQAHVASETLGPPTHLFAAIKDTQPPDPEDFSGIIRTYRAVRQIPGYLGAWPQPGALDRLPLGLGRGQPVGPGMSRLIGGIYRYTGGGFSVLSFYPELLQASLEHIAAVEAEEPAQVRLQVDNLVQSQLEGWVNLQLYRRAVDACLAGSNFLNLLIRQLKVEPSAAMVVAEDVLGARLQCTLGGEYQLDADGDRWISSAWSGDEPTADPPASYVAPLLTWFRGIDAQLTQYDDRVIADATIEIERRNP